MTKLFRNAVLVEFDPPSVREGMDVLVEDEAIREVGNGLAGEDKVVDCSGRLLFPGLVCSHHHIYSGLARGVMAEIGPTPDFVSILRNLWWRMDRAIDEPSLRSSGMICNLDAIRAGTTSVIDHHASPEFIAGSLRVIKETFEETGLRGATCYEVTDRRGTEGMVAGVEENLAFARLIDAEKQTGTWSGLTEAHIGGHAPVTLPDDALRRIADACAQSGRGFHVHLAEDRYDVSHSHATYGVDLIPRLESFGLLSEKTVLVHGVHLASDEIESFNDHDCFLVHNARSNMNNNVGYTTRLPEVKNLALGTDGIGADMFEETRTAYLRHKDAGGSWGPGDFLNALASGNRLLERIYGARFGRIEPGYKADLVVAAYQSPTPLVAENIAGHMVFGMGSGMVETVMVNGRLVMEDRKFGVDVDPIYAEAREQSRALWKRMDAIRP